MGSPADDPARDVASTQIRAGLDHIQRSYGPGAWRSDLVTAQRAHKRRRLAMLRRLYLRVRP